MKWKNVWKAVSVIASTAGGAAVGYASTHLEEHVPTSSAQWKALGMGAFVATLVAVGHLWQAPPGAVVVKQGGPS
jgi:hypothetical protein